MRDNIKQVLGAFARGETCKGKNFSTNGASLYSYNLCIGYKNAKGDVTLLEYNDRMSATTRSHLKCAQEHFGTVARAASCGV
jgi:hypothetical protein